MLNRFRYFLQAVEAHVNFICWKLHMTLHQKHGFFIAKTPKNLEFFYLDLHEYKQ